MTREKLNKLLRTANDLEKRANDLFKRKPAPPPMIPASQWDQGPKNLLDKKEPAVPLTPDQLKEQNDKLSNKRKSSEPSESASKINPVTGRPLGSPYVSPDAAKPEVQRPFGIRGQDPLLTNSKPLAPSAGKLTEKQFQDLRGSDTPKWKSVKEFVQYLNDSGQDTVSQEDFNEVREMLKVSPVVLTRFLEGYGKTVENKSSESDPLAKSLVNNIHHFDAKKPSANETPDQTKNRERLNTIRENAKDKSRLEEIQKSPEYGSVKSFIKYLDNDQRDIFTKEEYAKLCDLLNMESKTLMPQLRVSGKYLMRGEMQKDTHGINKRFMNSVIVLPNEIISKAVQELGVEPHDIVEFLKGLDAEEQPQSLAGLIELYQNPPEATDKAPIV